MSNIVNIYKEPWQLAMDVLMIYKDTDIAIHHCDKMVDCYPVNSDLSNLWLDTRLYLESHRVIKMTELQEY